jgi:pyrimidine operon attenuation protein/uracil phosphoribosyltransferase
VIILRKLIDAEKMHRTIRRISHEIIEQNSNLEDLVILGVKKKGVPLAKIIQENIKKIENIDVPIYDLDISGYRDDRKVEDYEKLNIRLDNKTVLVVDDVLFTGRTVRASMDAVIDLGRPSKIQLAVLIDRGHRELPIRADFVGKNMPTSANESVRVSFSDEIGVFIISKEEKE